MADALLSPLLEKLTDLILNEIGAFRGAGKELQNLKGELEAIKSTMEVADGLPYFTVEGVKDWLQELKDVAYDVEDIVDEYQAGIDKRRRMVVKMKQVCGPFTNFCPLFDKHICLRYKLGRDIRVINQRLAQISKEKYRYHLHELASRKQKINADRATNCFMVEEDIIGRDNEKEVLVEKLVSRDTTMGGGRYNVSIISVVGIGGLGKTTLAKMVFNDDRVRKHFGESCWWVFISQGQSAEDVSKKILEEIRSKDINISQLNTRSRVLSEALSEKKFLLVLDDVWDLDWWGEMEPLLMNGPAGSKIIITTRKKDISKGVGANIYELENFTYDKSWNLFLKHALKENEAEEDLERLDLKDIAENIVGKCGGLPLVVKTVGKVMKSKKRSMQDWQYVANNKIWGWKMPSSASRPSFLPGLILSYDDLPSVLKSYFKCVSLYPKGFLWTRRDLIMTSMAHGLVENTDETDMEVAANHHIDDMLDRCLFQLMFRSKTNPNDDILQMHDIIHDLATHVAEKEYSHNFVNKHTRHLIVTENSCSLDQIGLEANRALRTLIWPLQESSLDKYMNNLKMLRVLDLSRGNFTKLPNSIGDLLLLKHLKLMDTKIKELPTSIGKLQNLLSLLLDGSEIKELRKEIGQLCNLRHLSVENTPQLKFVAEGLGELTCLRTLNRFILCSPNETDAGCKIRELKKLSKLSGKLSIENLERVARTDDAKEALLQEKQHIKTLELTFGNIMIREGASEEEEERRVAEFQEHLLLKLRLPPKLKVLVLKGYCGKKLPLHWFDGHVHLEKLELLDCSWIERLPSFPTIKFLHIGDCCHLKALDASPCLEKLVIDGCLMLQQLPFSPKLERVELNCLDNWDGWTTPIEKGTRECLKVLEIRYCPKLKRLPQFPALQKLEIWYCEKFCALQEEEEAESKLNSMPALTELQIGGCPALLLLPSMPVLNTLNVGECENWEGWSLDKDATMGYLWKVSVSACPKLRTLPRLPALTRMEAFQCEQLCTPWEEGEQPVGLEVLGVTNCPNMSFQVDWLLPVTKLRGLTADWCPPWAHVTASHMAALQRLSFLQILLMPGQCPFPQWLWQLSSLHSLSLSATEARSLQGSWQNLKQLQILGIVRSPQLISLEGLFKNSPHDSGDPLTADEQNHPSHDLTYFCVPPKLLWLLFVDCPNLRSLPDGFQHLVHLKNLTLCHLQELALMPQSVSTLPELRLLEIEDCPNLASLPAGLDDRVGRGLEVSGYNCPALL